MQVSILGCGWLGIPLAQSLRNNGYTVKGSTTSQAKLEALNAVGIEPFIISLNADTVSGDILRFLSNTDVLIIDIPPRSRGTESESFTLKIKNLIPYIEQSGIKQVLFVSSISVYGNNEGIITEDSIPLSENDSGKQLLETERLLQNNNSFKTTVLRFAGLIGLNRHPVNHLAGKENLPNPNASINLIHQKDCITIIEKIIEKNTWGETFNAAAPFHPIRKEYYTQKAIELGLIPPTFNDDKNSRGKIISSKKLINILDYHFSSLV